MDINAFLVGFQAGKASVPTALDYGPQIVPYQEKRLVLADMRGETTIPDNFFLNQTKLVNVTMPNVTRIGTSAFSGCTYLALTELPDTLTSIGTGAFNECTQLDIKEIPSGVTTFGGGVFTGCSKLSSITFRGTPTSMPNSIFGMCRNIKTINVPWAEGEVSGAPWGATKATVNYNYKGD